jgi:hypothetical protein
MLRAEESRLESWTTRLIEETNATSTCDASDDVKNPAILFRLKTT